MMSGEVGSIGSSIPSLFAEVDPWIEVFFFFFGFGVLGYLNHAYQIIVKFVQYM